MINIENNLANKRWRMENLYKIKDKNKRLVKCKFNKIQNLIYEDIKDQTPIRHFSLKSRQTGLSTFWLIWHLDECIFHNNTSSAILAHKWESLHYLWEIIRLAFYSMPNQIKPILGEETARSFYFKKIESRIFISLSIRGASLHNLHVSEWAFCQDSEIQATLGACSPYTNISGETTGNGIANDAYLTYQDSKTKDNEYISHFIAWFLADEYRLPLQGISPKYIMRNLNKEEKKLQDIMQKDYNLELKPEQVLFRRQKKKALKSLFLQEFPEQDVDAFITSGSYFFDIKKWMALLEEVKEWLRGESYYKKDNEYICFEKPIKGDIYVAGADTSEGVTDSSVLKIINVTKRREAFVFRSRCGVKRFYKECDNWGRFYNNALLAVEDNNTGHAVLLGLEDITRYPNLYKEKKITRVGKGSSKIKVKLGWHTDKTSRVVMLNDLKYGIEEDEDIDVDNFSPEFTVFDEMVIKEVLTFIKKNDKYEAEEGKHDDDIFATAIAFQMYLKMRHRVNLKSGLLVGKERESL